MPELAELKLTSDYVNASAKGLTFVNVKKNPLHKGQELDVPFKKFTLHSESYGKEMVMYICDKLSPQVIPVRMTMGMAGHFQMTNTSQEPKHAHLMFYSKDGTTLSFVDVRRFGKWKQGFEFSDNRGPDPTVDYLKFTQHINSNLHRLKKPLFEVLMDQKYFNGIGNYLRAEIIYRAGDVDPFLPANEQLAKYPKILELCRDIPMLAYAKGGGSIKDWANPFGDQAIQEKFMLCYGNPEMIRIKDRNGRTFWFEEKWYRVENN